MRRFILIGICICASVFLFSQQSFANLHPVADISTIFEQTGSWAGTPSNLTNGQSTSWSSSGPGSWYLTPTSLGNTGPFISGSYPLNFYATYNLTFSNETMDFYYQGTEYITSGSGTGTLVFHSVGGAFTATGSTFDIKFSSGLHPINFASNGTFTTYNINNWEVQGNINNVNQWPGVTAFGGNITGLQGSITGTPIPGAVWLLGSGLLGLVGIRRKFKV